MTRKRKMFFKQRQVSLCDSASLHNKSSLITKTPSLLLTTLSDQQEKLTPKMSDILL